MILDINQAVEEVKKIREESGDNSVLVRGYNAMTSDMIYIYSCFVIEAPLRDRAIIIKAHWKLADPKAPLGCETIECLDPNEIKSVTRKHLFDFREEILGDGFDKEINIGLNQCKGYSQLFKEGGVAAQLSAFYDREAPKIISFLEGKEYEDIDTTYDNSWGSW